MCSTEHMLMFRGRRQLGRVSSTVLRGNGRLASGFINHRCTAYAKHALRSKPRLHSLLHLGWAMFNSKQLPDWSLYQQNQPKDFAQQAVLSAQLLSHYSAQWKDRQIYWMTRTRSRTERDILSNIIDSFDHSKVMLPRFPGKRTPKSSVYDSLKRALHALVIAPSGISL